MKRLSAVLVWAAVFAATIARAASPVGGETSVVKPPSSALSSVAKRAFYLAGVWCSEPISGKVLKAKKIGGKWVLSGLSDLKIYPNRIHLTWRPHNFPEASLPDLIAGDFLFAVRLDGAKLKRGPDGDSGDYYMTVVKGLEYFGCPAGMTCLDTTIAAPTWFGAYPPWNVELELAKRKRVPQPVPTPKKKPCPGDPSKNCAPKSFGSFVPEMFAVATIERGPIASFFESSLYPTFQHARCSTCHSLGSTDALVAQHEGILEPGIVVPQQTGHGTVLTCGGGCHHTVGNSVPGTQFDEVEWKTPGFDMGIELAGKSPKDICKTVKEKLPSAAALKAHFHEDARIGWAVHSGEVPSGEEKPVAPPGTYSKWVTITNQWIDAGSPCPN